MWCRSGDLERRDRQPRGRAQHEADQQLLPERDQHRAGRLQIDRVGGAMQRKQDGGEHQRDHEPHAHRHAHLAEARQQHQHGADAREHQHEGGRIGGQERDVDAHAPIPGGSRVFCA